MRTRLGGWLVATAAALVILGASVAPFLTPPVVGFEQDRVNAAALTALTGEALDNVTGSLLADLVLWRSDFTERLGVTGDLVHTNDTRVLTVAEASHMRDVRVVFTAFWFLVLASVVLVALALRRAGGADARSGAWRAVRNGARGLAVAVALLGTFAVIAFDTAFELFHRLLFSAGSYAFDPASSMLVRLFPDRFWSEITIAVGVVAIVLALATATFAGRRAGRAASSKGAAALNATRAGA